jgi:hypothetical protein
MGRTLAVTIRWSQTCQEQPFSRTGSNDRIWPLADCLLVVAIYREADLHHQIWVGNSDPFLPFTERLPSGVTESTSSLATPSWQETID